MSVPVCIPESLSRNVEKYHKEEGVAWLKRLPELLSACARRWDLRIDRPMTEDYAEMSLNYIARR